MSTTIDTIQVEIQSSSANAAKGIQELSTALAGLKANGKITTAVNNLNNLRKALHSFSNIPSNASKVLSLASSLERLKSVGSVATIGNSLTKLATSLKTLNGVSVDKGKIDGIADALSSLSAVKAGGINTMMTGLLKIGQVTKTLDDDAINDFADRVEKLSEKLTPLSTKMTTIQSGFKGINSEAKKAASSLEKVDDQVHAGTFNLSNAINVIQGVVQALDAVVQKLIEITSDAVEWDGIAARFGRGFGPQAQETYAWIQRLNEEMGINIQQFMQYSSVYATMLTGFGVAHEDATKMALGYAELTYDIWAGYNDIYKNFDEAAEAVKSAIAGEVEPIRRAGFTIVESTLEQTAANHGLEISLYSATEAQKSYLRYLTLVDQAHAQGLVGTYAKELNTAEGLLRTLAQQMKSLAQTLGSLFLPILVKTVPWIQAFVELLTEAIKALAAFLGVTIQDVEWSGFGESIGGAAENAGNLGENAEEATQALKDLKKATIGIDELNVISPPSASGSNGGSAGGGAGDGGFGGLDVDSLWDETIFDTIQDDVDAIKEKIKDWIPVINTVAAAFGALSLGILLAQMGESLDALRQMDKLSATLKRSLAGLAILTIEAVLVFMLADEYLETGNLLPLVGEALATAAGGYLMYKGFGTKGLLFSLGVSIAAQLLSIGMNLADGGVTMTDPQLWIQAAFTTALGGIAGGYLSYKGFTTLTKGQGVLLGLTAGLSLTMASITAGSITADGLGLENVLTGMVSTVMGGLSGASAFKYLGKSPGKGFLIGATASLGITITSVAVGEIKENGWSWSAIFDTLLGAISLGAAGAGIGSLIAPGPGTVIGFVIGAGVSIVTTFVSAGESDSESEAEELEEAAEEAQRKLKRLERELANRFGSIELSVKEMGVLVETVSAIPREIVIDTKVWNEKLQELESSTMVLTVSAAIEFHATENAKTESLEDAVEKALATLDSYNLKIKLGIDVDNAEYETAVEAYINSAQSLLDQYYLTASISVSILGGDTGLSESLSSFYTKNSAELAELGNRFRETVSSAFVDGEWIPDKLNEAMEIQKEIQDILAMISKVEYEAKVLAIDLDLSGAELTQESFETAMKELKEAAELQLGNLEEIRLDALEVAILEYNANIADGMAESEAAKIRDAQIAEIEEAYRNAKVDVSFGSFDWGISTMQEQFEEELKAFAPNFGDILERSMNVLGDPSDYVKDDAYVQASLMFTSMLAQYKLAATTAVDEDGRAAMEEILKSLEPTITEYEKIARDAYKAGSTVPQKVREGLNDANELKALTGDVDAINYMIGQGFSTDPVFFNTLATVKKAGMGIPDAMAEGFLTNIEVMRDATTGAVTGIKDTVTGEVTEMTPILRENLKSMGMDLSAGLKEGIDADEPNLWDRFTKWGSGILDKIRGVFEIHSPSKATQRMGEQLSQGLTMKLDANTLKNRISDMWGKAKTWWDKSKGSLKTYTPSIGSIYEKLSDRWSNARTWWNDKKPKVKEYTPSIGSIYEKLSVRWSNARDWWNKKKGSMSYTPSIGSITDKIKSAWSSAKSWWSKNAKLSTKLDVQVPKIKVNWDTASAFGKSFKYPTSFKLTFAADGGIFNQGSLIWAGERGPEVVANAAGGKTGVMNVQQMQDAVYEGVYAAVVAAMGAVGGNNGSQPVNVYLDGKQITSAVERRQRERGAALMGNQVYSY